MEQKRKTRKTDHEGSEPSWEEQGESLQARHPTFAFRDADPEINNKIAKLVESFEGRIRKLKEHVSELEARLDDVSTVKDRFRLAYEEFLNIEELNQMIRGTQDPGKVIEALRSLIGRFIEYDALGIFLFDASRKRIEPLGPVAARLSQAAQSQYEEGILEWVISERRSVVVPWTESFGVGVDGSKKNLIISPLIVDNHPMGVCLLSTSRHPERFSASELKLLFFAVSHAAAALQNAIRTREIAGTNEFLSNLLDNAGDIIFSLDRAGKFTYLNPRIEELGYRKEDLLHQHYKILFRQPETEKRIQSTLQLGAKQVFELELRTSAAQPQQFTINLVPLKEGKTRWSGALGIMRNVTEINRLQKKLLESERLAAYTQTVITLNHEINNPLTTVLGNIFLLERDTKKLNDEKLEKRINVIQENCVRIQKVIKKLEKIDELKTVSYLGSTKMVDLGDGEDS